MCFSPRASMIAFMAGIIGSILCILLGTITDQIVGYFFAFLSLIQGIEYLLWTHQICDDYNKRLSILGMWLNHLQPVVLGILILTINTGIRYPYYILSVLFVYLSIIIPYSLQFTSNHQCTVKNAKQHLQWNWNLMDYSIPVYFSFFVSIVLLCLLGFPKLKHGIMFSITGFIIYATSLIIYNRDAGSLWCYYSVFIPIVYYLLRVTKKIIT
jgi:hypothetical protein